MALSNYKPESPQSYKGDQIIINSGRILFNAKEDSVFLFSKKAIGLSSSGTINIDSDSYTIINSPKIYLGLDAHREKEPLLLGETTNNLLTDLITALNRFTTLIKSGGGSPQAVMAAAGALEATLINVNLKLKSKELLSKQNFTI